MPYHGVISNEKGKIMGLKIRFLLTSKCTATCGYCHNEGQSQAGNLLSLDTIRQVLHTLHANACQPEEIVLSGGEPTLHKQLGDIARLCRASGAHVSMDSHAGHPTLLAAALPYLDELKVHVDSFDAAEQQASMGIELAQVLTSIRQAQSFPLQLRTNHPLKCAQETATFISHARQVGIDCKIIEMFGQNGHVSLDDMDWSAQGYHAQVDGSWLHDDGLHRLFTKRCGAHHNDYDTLFIGADGIRRALNGVIIGCPEAFSIKMVRTALLPSSCTLTEGS